MIAHQSPDFGEFDARLTIAFLVNGEAGVIHVGALVEYANPTVNVRLLPRKRQEPEALRPKQRVTVSHAAQSEAIGIIVAINANSVVLED